MSAAPLPAVADDSHHRPRLVRQRVLLLLLIGLLAALAGLPYLPFLTLAPNRLLSGHGVPLIAVIGGGWWLLSLPLALLALAVVAPPTRRLHAATAAAAAILLAGLLALAGAEAARQAVLLTPLARVSLGGGGWIALLLIAAIGLDALQRRAPRRHWGAALFVLPALLLAGGALDSLALLKEYQNRRDVFDAALLRHLQIVALALLAALAIGLPLGWAAARRRRLARPVFGLLNLVQTIPAIALFGLLIGPLAWLGRSWPGSGVQGIGLLPAVVALTLYALLPIVRGVVAGLQQVPAGVIETATGMGMSPRQRLFGVELPLALPVLLAALRLTTVQLIGLTVVAALIGAGGLGAIVFQGLLSSALDLVLLGVIPVVALALLADAGFTWLLGGVEVRR